MTFIEFKNLHFNGLIFFGPPWRVKRNFGGGGGTRDRSRVRSGSIPSVP